MQHYLFDFDGTLVDSMPTYISVMLRILDENHIPYGSDIVKIITPMGYLNTAKYYRSLGLDMPEEEIVALMHKYAFYEYANNVAAKAHVIPVLRRLKANGKDLNILTASPHGALDPCLKRLGIWDLFTNIWSCEDFGTSKADPNIYVMAAHRIGAPVSEVLFLDDNYHADRTAKAAGMAVCGVYDASSRDYEDEIRSVSDYYIRDFSELNSIAEKEDG